MTRLRRSQAGPSYEAACAARPLFGTLPWRAKLPLWLWHLHEGSYVAFRPGYWSKDRGVAFGRVIANRILRRTGEFPREDPAIAARAEELPVFDAEVWFPADPLGPGYGSEPRVLVPGVSNGGVLRYVSEGEALTLRALLPAWLAGEEPRPLPPEVLRAIFGAAT